MSRPPTPTGRPALPAAAARIAAALLSLLALVAVAVLPGRAGAQEGPPLTADPALLDRALQCSGLEAPRDAVVLIHGTTSTPQESWRSGYAHALAQWGFPVCTVELPGRSMGDIQASAEYVVHAVRSVTARTGRHLALVGHSQGGLQALWAVRWWPDVRSVVTDVIGLGTPFSGTLLAGLACHPFPGCPPAVWQMAPRSAFLRAATAQPLPSGPAFTSIGTVFDEIVTPGAAAMYLPGATNILVQEICPGRPVEHVSLIYDHATWAIVQDALAHDGPADAARVPRSACGTLTIPFAADTFLGDILPGLLHQAQLLVAPRVPAEPALRPYAQTAG